MLLRYPSYFESFSCIASACPDSCCKEWDVAVDKETLVYYRQISGPLGEALERHLYEENGQWYFAVVDGRCPMWRQDSLCRIQAELGHAALCQTCRDFPRLTHDYGNFVERGLELSCPEAAKIILSDTEGTWLCRETNGGEPPEYDTEIMQILLRTRQEALELLTLELPIQQRLALLLLYGYHAQGQIDGGPDTSFSPDAALQDAYAFGKNGDTQALAAFFRELEILSPQWLQRLSALQPGPWLPLYGNLARYFVERYWLQAVSDYDLVSRVKFTVISCLLIRLLGGDPVQTAQAYSKEIENNSDNVEAILEGAYCAPAFTDEKLLSLLLKK